MTLKKKSKSSFVVTILHSHFQPYLDIIQNVLTAIGPPCQGFSGMNRYKESAGSKTSRELILTALSFLEFYRPKYFVMVSFKL